MNIDIFESIYTIYFLYRSLVTCHIIEDRWHWEHCNVRLDEPALKQHRKADII